MICGNLDANSDNVKSILQPLWNDWHTSELCKCNGLRLMLVELQISVMVLVQFGSHWFWNGLAWYDMVWPGMPWWRLHLFVIIHAFVCDFNDCIWFMSFDVQSFLARFRKALFCWSPNGQSAANAHSFSISTEASNFCWFLCLLSLVSSLVSLFSLLPLVNYATHENK